MIFKHSAYKHLAALLAGIALLSASAAASVLQENLPSTALVGQQSDASSNSPLVTQIISLAGPVTINSFTWWGYDLGGAIDPVDDFLVTGDLIGAGGTWSIVSTQVIDSDVELVEYRLDLDQSVSFAGGTTSVSVVNNSLDVEWYWQGSSDIDGPRAYSIEGTRQTQDIPEPGSLALLGLALAGLGLARVRRLH